MRLTEIYNVIDGLAPFALSGAYCKAYDAYDNSGVLLDCGEEITGALFSLDCSLAAAAQAVAQKKNLLITHHPAIFSPLSRLQRDGEGAAVLALARTGISVISAHLNLDCAAGGIDESLMQGLGGRNAVPMHELQGGAYGRAYDVTPCSLNEFTDRLKNTFATERVIVYGNAPVKRAASFCGAGFDDDSLAFALKQNADTLVTSDGKHHLIAEAVERGLNVVLLTHYAAEYYGFERFYQRVKERLSIPCAIFTDRRFL